MGCQGFDVGDCQMAQPDILSIPLPSTTVFGNVGDLAGPATPDYFSLDDLTALFSPTPVGLPRSGTQPSSMTRPTMGPGSSVPRPTLTPPAPPEPPPIADLPSLIPTLGPLLSAAAIGILGVLYPSEIGEGQVPLYIPPPPLPEFPPLDIPTPQLSPEPALEPIPELTVTAPALPYEFFPSEPGATRSPGGNVTQPDFEYPLSPAISPTRIIGPAAPRLSPGLSPNVKPIPAPAPAPTPRVSPAPSPFAQPAPARAAPVPTMTAPQVPTSRGPSSSSLTAPQAGALGSVPPARIGVPAKTATATSSASCTCPGTKGDEQRKEKYGCRQGYFNETADGITYITWSTRRCPSSKTSSPSQRARRPTTS